MLNPKPHWLKHRGPTLNPNPHPHDYIPTSFQSDHQVVLFVANSCI